MAKKKGVSKITTDYQNVSLNQGSVLATEVLEGATQAVSQTSGVPNQPIIFIDEMNDWQKVREYNKQRFLNYCHKGTILEHGTSKVKWEVLGFEDVVIREPGPGFTMFEISKRFLKIQSLNVGKKLRKKYTKTVDPKMFYMYDIVDVPEAVKVLWGDPKENPPKKPGDEF